MPPTSIAYPSPKRKRDQPPPIPLLNTALRPASTPPRGSPAPSSGADSPRNAVADQLRGMTLIATSAISMSPLTPTDDVIRKKPKLDETRVDSGTSLDSPDMEDQRISWKNNNKLDSMAVLRKSDPAREIPETPQSQPRILTDIASFAQPTAFVSSPGPTPTHQSSKQSLKARTQNRSSSHPRPLNMSPSPPPSALTWHDSEITGHLADPSIDPDDDGTGLNGIGFKPTPAIAYARSQKRRQQLNEWKARETREARAKRHDRRRRGVGGAASREVTVEREVQPPKDIDVGKRMVKFAI
ncbi:hypothetical protein CC86DRAFT_210822 [Ophiobolus disseminans]|uniref:Uncharacterized protein n=1 Tax=Ophiobolus disseminans TaxID=1469910 RepID=A0A6A7A431_9PLEO|nr:hypothetical protein CC86DRAFT_210822 [Ophiobolus disseminans]